MSIGIREKKARVTCTISFDLEYFQKWMEKDKEINADAIASYLELPDNVNIRGVYTNSVEIKCDNCTTWKHESAFSDSIQCAGSGKDFCIECDEELQRNEQDDEVA